LAEPEEIVVATLQLLSGNNLNSQDFAGQHVMITAGPTVEDLDPVRFISNRSSGKMGYAMAEAARDRGARVTLVTGPTKLQAPAGVESINVRSTREMFDAVMSRLNDVAVFIGCAAVADYRPVKLAEHKIKKQGQAKITLELEPTEDIIASVAADPNRNGRLVAGFAAESQTLLDYAEKKLREKKLDLIVANDIKRADAGFDVETNTATILTRDGARVELPLQNKREMADRVLDEILRLK
jgi:phosphopantothenoylcysteine decarboxylase/phosphopantothenate--cysteine ligase